MSHTQTHAVPQTSPDVPYCGLSVLAIVLIVVVDLMLRLQVLTEHSMP